MYYLYTFVRRTQLILDFALTLVLNHLILTTYYSATLPSSPFFWLMIVSGACLTIISVEQLCVRREMREGLNIGVWLSGESADGEEVGVESMELGLFHRD